MVLETRELQFKNLLSTGDGFNGSPSPTLSLLPPSHQSGGSSKPETVNVTRPKNQQLTIFYAGSVNVFDNISEEKANAIMLLAGNSVNGSISHVLSYLEQHLPAALPAPAPAAPPAHKVRKVQAMASPGQQHNLQLSLNRPAAASNVLTIPHVASPVAAAQAAGLPQARKASLTRFLQRRKERAIQKMECGEDKSASDSVGKSPDCSAPPEEHLMSPQA